MVFQCVEPKKSVSIKMQPLRKSGHHEHTRESQLKADEKCIHTILRQTLEQATQFLSTINDRPVGVRPNSDSHSTTAAGGEAFSRHRHPLPAQGIGAEAALKLFEEKYLESISGSAGPRYLGFVTGGSTPAAIAGDWLVSAFDQNAAFSGDSCAPYIEKIVIHWLADLFGLSDAHSGAFVSGATMANFVGLAIARQWVAHRAGVDVAQDGLYSLPQIKILSGSPHSSIYKALSMLGLGRKSLQTVKCLHDRDAVDLAQLREALQSCASSGQVCIVVGNAGTVNSGDFDDLSGIAELKQEFDFWLHVDAAFGGFAACSPRYSHLVEGIDAADSVTVDGHKWLNVPYDSAMQFSRHRQLQVEVFQNSAAYLGAVSSTDPDFVHLTPENSRRFRALPAWFSLTAYGKKGYGDLVEQSCELAAQLQMKIEASPNFFINLHTTCLNVVSFALAGASQTSAETFRFIEAVNQTGEMYLTPTVYRGVPGIRAAFSNWRTLATDLEIIWDCLVEAFEEGGF